MSAWKNWRPRRPASPVPDDDPAYDEYDEQPEDEDQDDGNDVQDDDGEPWYSVGSPAAADPDGPQTWTVSPGVQITVAAPPPHADAPSPASLRRPRIRRWIARHLAAAGVGWCFGLYQSIDAFLSSLGHGGAAAGLALAGFGWWFAEVVTDRLGRLPLVPRRVLPALHWAARVPFATALLVTALHTPHALVGVTR